MTVTFLNPKTCGIYKDGGTRYKTDPDTGRRTTEIDNQLIEQIDAYLSGQTPEGAAQIALEDIFNKRVLAPTYYDDRYNGGIKTLLQDQNLEGITIGELIDNKAIRVRGGHGSPGNDQRSGHIPYVKVSDIRGLRININPTNLVTESVARRFWRSDLSGLEAWDLITPNRASSNIGEFALLLPGEEQVVLTKEVFVFRVVNNSLFDQFYLLWALSLKAVRDQWRRIVLMQTNREDCGNRYKEIIIPIPKDKAWGEKASEPFRKYFSTIAIAKTEFIESVHNEKYEHIANVVSAISPESVNEEHIQEG